MIGGIQYASMSNYGANTPTQPRFRDIYGNSILLEDLRSYVHSIIGSDNTVDSNDIIKNEYAPRFDLSTSKSATNTPTQSYDPSKILHPKGPITPKYKLPKRKKDKDTFTPELDIKGYMSADNLFDALGSAFSGKALENYKQWTEVWKKYGSRIGIKDDEAYCYFLAQLMHETGNFTSKEEGLYYTSAKRVMDVFKGQFKSEAEVTPYLRNPKKLAMRVYGNRKDLGNTTAEDGWTYRGRGFIQLTGKSNYIAVNEFLKKIGVVTEEGDSKDIVKHPELLATDFEIAALSAIGYMLTRNGVVNAANAHDVDALTEAVNGKKKEGLADREAKTNQLLQILNDYRSKNPNSDLA